MRIHLLVSLFVVQSFAACMHAQDQTTEIAVSSVIHTEQHNQVTSPEAATSNTLFKSNDGGLTWQNISTGLPADKSVECFFAKNGEVILGLGQMLYRSPTGSAAPGWEQEILMNGGVSGIFPGRSGLYAVNNSNGFSQQISKGLWLPVFSGLGKKSFRAVFESAAGAIFVGCDDGIFKSTDGGSTWKHVVKEGWMLEMVESEGVLICTSEQGILRSADGGENWEVVVAEGGVGIDVEVIKGGFAEISYNTTSETRRVRISEDAGKTWQPIDADLPAQSSISGIKQIGELLLCGHPDGIMRSKDRGKTWQLVFPSLDNKVFNLSVSDGVVYAVLRAGGC